MVTCLLSDDGTELQGEFDELCRERRIEHRTSVAYYHNGNARAERMWETLLKNTRTMLQHSHLPDVHWYRALQHAAYVYNRTPRRMPVYTDGQPKHEMTTPYYQSHKVIPDLSMLKVWGCLAFAYKEEAKRDKARERGGASVPSLGTSTTKAASNSSEANSRNGSPGANAH